MAKKEKDFHEVSIEEYLAEQQAPNADALADNMRPPPEVEEEWAREAIAYDNPDADDDMNDDTGPPGDEQPGAPAESAQVARSGTAKKLTTFTAQELEREDIPPLDYVIEGLLPKGLTILGGPSKSYKSYMCLDMALSIAGGNDFLGFPTMQGDVLYLALEDGKRRLQKRQRQICPDGAFPSALHFCIKSSRTGEGFEEEIDAFMEENPDTVLIIVDIYEKVRGAMGSRSGDAYQTGSQDIAPFKELADKHDVCLLIVHHTRKFQKGDDKDWANTFSGDLGKVGAADTLMGIFFDTRGNKTATLKLTSRDIESKALLMEFGKNHRWRLLESIENVDNVEDIIDYRNDPIIEVVRKLLQQNPKGFEMLSSELAAAIPEHGFAAIDPNVVGKRLKRYIDLSWERDGIVITPSTSSKRRAYRFEYADTQTETENTTFYKED
ncbi:AAA family ATPase [Ruminococcaceae bacterium OttesenSCG-928-D13]|nr:AAA family ATPase [Ruminococcaceae bacterium OttesenSCG-928-D13]